MAAVAQSQSRLSAKAASRAVHRQSERACFAWLAFLRALAFLNNRSYRRHGASQKEAPVFRLQSLGGILARRVFRGDRICCSFVVVGGDELEFLQLVTQSVAADVEQAGRVSLIAVG